METDNGMRTYWFLVGVLICAAPKSDATSVISFGGGVGIQAFWGPPQYDPQDSYSALCTPTNGTSCTVDFNLNLTDIDNVTRNYQGASTSTIDVGYGHVFLSSTINVINDQNGFHSFGSVNSFGSFQDSITIFAPPGALEPGRIVFVWNCAPALFCSPSSDIGGGDFNSPSQWVSGAPLLFSGRAFITIARGYGSFCPDCPTNLTESIVLDQILVLDASLAPLSGFTYLTASGTAYSVPGGTQIPEPSALLLVGCGVLFGAVVRWQQIAASLGSAAG